MHSIQGITLPLSALLHALRFRYICHEYIIVARYIADDHVQPGPWSRIESDSEIDFVAREYLRSSPSGIANFIEQTGFYTLSVHESPARRLLSEVSKGTHFVVLRRTMPQMNALPHRSPSEDDDELGQENEEEEAASTLSWFEACLEDASGPVSNVRYEIELTDGKTYHGTSDKSGTIRYPGILHGECRLRLLADG